MARSEMLQVVIDITSKLDNLDIPYVIGGSVASIIHGVVRTTMDVDIVAAVQSHHVPPLIALLKDSYYADEQMMLQAIARRSSFNLIHLETMFKADIFIPKPRTFDQQQLKRRIAEPIDSDSNDKIWVLSAEDIVLAKLDWFRLGGEMSERQWRDILGVLKTQQNQLDVVYLRQWGQSLDVSDLLERALEEMLYS